MALAELKIKLVIFLSFLIFLVFLVIHCRDWPLPLTPPVAYQRLITASGKTHVMHILLHKSWGFPFSRNFTLCAKLKVPLWFSLLLLSHRFFYSPLFFLLSTLGLFISHSAPLRFQTTEAQSLRQENFSINCARGWSLNLGVRGWQRGGEGREGKLGLWLSMQRAFGGQDIESGTRGRRGHVEVVCQGFTEMGCILFTRREKRGKKGLPPIRKRVTDVGFTHRHKACLPALLRMNPVYLCIYVTHETSRYETGKW